MSARFSLSTLIGVSAICSAAAFAAGRALPGGPSPGEPPHAAEIASGGAPGEASPHGGSIPMSGELPPGHPAIPEGNALPGAGATAGAGSAAAEEGSLAWKVPARWKQVPNPSTMRLATYRTPSAEGDREEPEMAVSQAGGGVDANVERWLGQFDAAARKTSRKTTRTVAGLAVTVVEIEGTFSGGMGTKGPEEKAGWALVGVIVDTPSMPHFFKLLGPAKSVRAARGDVDALIASFSPR